MTARLVCAVCSAETDAVYRLCQPCLRTRVATERAAQGLPPTIEDPATLAKVVVLLSPAVASAAPAERTVPAAVATGTVDGAAGESTTSLLHAVGTASTGSPPSP